MTDQEKDKLIVEALGECWHSAGKSTLKNEDGDYQCTKCKRWFEYCDSEHWNPKISTWGGFGWIWERAQKMEWWEDFMDWINLEYAKGHKGPEFNHYVEYLIHSTRFRDALAEFLERRIK